MVKLQKLLERDNRIEIKVDNHKSILLPKTYGKITVGYLIDNIIIVLFRSKDPQNIRAFDLHGNELWALTKASRYRPEVYYVNLWEYENSLLCATVECDVFEIINLEKGFKKRWGK